MAAAGRVDGHLYPELGRSGAPGWWRVPTGVALLVLLALVGQAVAGVVVSAGLAIAGRDDVGGALDGDPVTPSYLALVNLGWAVAIAAACAVVVAVHRQPAGRLASVAGRLRWRWLFVCLGLSVVTLGVTLAVAAVLPEHGGDSLALGGTPNAFTDATRDFVLVIVLLTPLQAAGEEYVFRGYLAQALGSLGAPGGRTASAAVSVAVPAVLFALAHGAQDLPVFVDRLGFGVSAGLVVLLTGGLEAGIAMHVVNNLLAFGLALTFGDMTEALQPVAGSWWALPVTLTQSVVFVALTWLAARRCGVERRGGAVLAAQHARV